MDPIHRRTIQEQKVELENNIDLENLKRHLKDSKIFTRSMLDDIYKRKKSLFEELPSRGPEAFTKFVQVLKDADYGVTAERLDRLQYSNPKNINRCRWARGHCLIINNVNFPKNLPQRSNVEGDALENFFGSKWESTEIVNDIPGRSMLPTLTKFSDEDFRQVDLCVVIILSHGGKMQNCNFIYGADGETVFERDIFDIFSSNMCLSNIPKLFLLPSDDTYRHSYEKVPNFTDTYSIRWPNEVRDKLFGKVLVDCFTESCCNETIDLQIVVETAYKLFNEL